METVLKTLSPILWTKDLEKTIAFYVNILGFRSQSNFPNFASLSRDDIKIMIIVPIAGPDDCENADDRESFFPKPLMTGSIYIFSQNVDALWEDIRDKVTIQSSIADREYLMRDFSILDNNGYELVFGHHIS
ncbi:catechol 2,3-dioxygenase-like lactoylglutathione lyase family enzyme [Chryseobacterium defluvii]|uniref:Catechol 2,3-dioxygenase-like lactoylglutathione lyase family enzyme n=1 Tax=Chryseobacterium defluvii TaxID=160396 RepID=A0A840K862_9FLAO|nr:VOC family protein [Chryseobacterium defluvii]MBB4805406.1 catechol 2,3-dioxygenase-like lactoylglutathione lyase family enzyme [Chryseobacterium defluvii]